jgi:hypothetical protein
MATTTYKVLGQINPTANTISTLYQVPAYVNTVISTITVCNQGSTATSFTIAIRPANATLTTKHYLNYNTSLQPYDTVPITIGITLATTDVIDVSSTSSNVSFTAFGSEINSLSSSNIPTINTLTITDASYTTLSTTTISITTGSYIRLFGSGFGYNTQLYIGTATTSASYVSNVEIRALIPGQQSTGTYYLSLLNTGGYSTVYTPGLTYALDPFRGPTIVDYLAVGGGGAAGVAYAGGGGGGGVLAGTYNVAAGVAITVTIGAGGSGSATYGAATNGQNTSFGTQIAYGGGRGGDNGLNGSAGGSGGGAPYSGKIGGLATQPTSIYGGLGNKGGDSDPAQNFGGGGGGAGAVGYGGGDATYPGQGGVGVTNSLITVSLATSLNIGQIDTGMVYFAGGGGGWTRNNAYTAGGLGGGGRGYTSAVGGNAIANSGGGGGGTQVSVVSGSGGSGVVIVRHLNTFNSATNITGSLTTAINTGGYWIYTFRDSGTITF